MDTIHQVLFLTDLSRASDAAGGHARMIAEQFGARMLVYHAMEVPTAAYVGWGGAPERAKRERRSDEIRAELRRRCDTKAGPCEVVVQRDVVMSSLIAAIQELIATSRPDLIVMATHSRTELARAFVGSVAGQLLHDGVRPLLCVPPAAASAPHAPYRRLLVPTDLSLASRRALPWASLLARGFESELLAVYVEPPPTVAVLSGLTVAPPPPSPDDVRRFLAPELDGPRLAVEVAGPAPAWSAIVRLVAERQADLVVMSSSGHDTLGDHVLGSTTDRVIRHGRAPVLVA